MNNIEDYHETLVNKINRAKKIADEARSRGEDPKNHVEIELADNIASRCEKILGIPGLGEKIEKYEEEDLEREEIAFKLTEDFVAGEIGDYDSERMIIDSAVRSGVALLTEGIVAAPTEDGIGRVKMGSNPDGSEFIRIPYHGPIRSAGGTGQALSVLIADYARQLLNVSKFKPTEDEIERYIEELRLYDKEVSLQYMPDDQEIRKIIKNVPIMVDGSQTTEGEVEGYRNLDRINGNRGRGGMCLVIGEGIAQKAPKLKKYTDNLDIDGWDWLDEIIETSEKNTGEEENNENDDTVNRKKTPETGWKNQISPSNKYVKDALAGRPVFSDPSKKGGFRLRYGRARNTGLAACGYHPATMKVVDEYMVDATQLKTERPGKAAGVSPVDSIEGPTIKLNNGTVLQVNNPEKVDEIKDQIDEIIDLGETAVPYGEFLENNHPLAPSPYVHEWWIKELEKELEKEDNNIKEQINKKKLDYKQAKNISKKYNIPLHPKFTYLWHDINSKEYAQLCKDVINSTKNNDSILIDKSSKIVLEKLLVPHKIKNNKIKLNYPHSQILKDTTTKKPKENKEPIKQASETLGIELRHRSPTRIGARMGRPEKSKIREMNPKVHALFPISDKGGKQRKLLQASKHKKDKDMEGKGKQTEQGEIEVDISHRKCPECLKHTWRIKCENCKVRTKPIYHCPTCDWETIGEPEEGNEECPNCSTELTSGKNQTINLHKRLQTALDNINENIKNIENTKAVEGVLNKTDTHEFLEKGLLRGKYDISTFRDGTARYDMSDLPLTAFKPKEINLTIKQLKNLGYTEDINGNKITKQDQLIEIYPQDIILNENAGNYLVRVANFIDDLLENYYNLDPYYKPENKEKVEEKEDLIGNIVVGLAPHTSGGTAARIIGFTKTKTNYASPFFHAGKRRNCFHPDTQINYKINGKWKKTSIQNLVEKYLNPEINGYDNSYTGATVQNIKKHPEIKELKVPSMNNKGHQTIENVTHLSKHTTQNHLIKITLNDETTLKVTPDHDLPVKIEKPTDTLIKKKKAHQLKEGEKLFNYNQNKIKKVQNFKEIDLLNQLLTKNHNINLDNVLIHGIQKEQIHNLITNNKQPNKTSNPAKNLNTNKKKLNKYIQNQSIPVSILQKLYQKHNKPTKTITEKIPKNVTIGMKNENIKTPRIITIDEELTTLIKYYKSKKPTNTKKNNNSINIKINKKQSQKFIKNTLKKKFNVNPSHKKEQITVPGNIIKFFFKNIIKTENIQSTQKETITNKSHDTKTIKSIKILENSQELYNLTVNKTHKLEANNILSYQSDGDEDSVMLLMDGFLNFSESYLPDKRGRMMDAPIVLTTILDPNEVDDEAYNAEAVSEFDLKFYESTMTTPSPKKLKENIRIGEDLLDSNGMGFNHVLETNSISSITENAYSQGGSMKEKLDDQMQICSKIRAVNENKVGRKVIKKHFLPDIMGNLKAFSTQEFRCTNCNNSHRRIPLDGKCKRCNSNSVILTVHEGSVKKYIGYSKEIIDKYNIENYTEQRVKILDKRINSIFTDETSTQSQIEDFF